MLKSLKISTKIALLVIVSAIATIGSSLTGLIGMTEIMDKQDEITNNLFPKLNQLNVLNGTPGIIQRVERSFFIPEFFSNPKEVEHQKKSLNKYFNLAQNAITEFEKFNLSGEESKLWSNFKINWKNWLESHNNVLQKLFSNQHDEALALSVGGARDGLRSVEKSLDELIKYSNQKVNIANQEADNTLNFNKYLLIIVFVLLTSTVIILGLVIARSIIKPINNLVGFANKLADGDFSMLKNND
jgi:methyl-accepting chemotaxis protein